MDKPLISVIVPIYNVEKYLDKCITSIVNQTYKNLEIILVDDGSPDHCPSICDKWKDIDNRIIVIHKKNGGLSDARNAGLDICKGDYIAFVDSDDYIHCDMYKTLITTMQEHSCDMIQCDYINVIEDKKIVYQKDESLYSEYNREEAMKSLINEKPLKQVVWNKLYKRYIFDHLRFEVGKLNEDDFFMYQAIHLCHKVGYIDSIFYYYLIRNTSIMGNKFSIRRLDGLEARMRRYEFIRTNYESLKQIEQKNILFFILYNYQKALTITDSLERIEALMKIKTYFENVQKQIYIKQISFKEKIWIILMNLSLDFTAKIRNIMKIGC